MEIVYQNKFRQNRRLSFAWENVVLNSLFNISRQDGGVRIVS